MFGPGIRNVFASRWKAVWWAATILLTAYCTVPSPDQAEDPEAAAKAEAKIAAIMGVKAEKSGSDVQANPWAKDAK